MSIEMFRLLSLLTLPGRHNHAQRTHSSFKSVKSVLTFEFNSHFTPDSALTVLRGVGASSEAWRRLHPFGG